MDLDQEFVVEGSEAGGYVPVGPSKEVALREAGSLGAPELIEHEVDYMLSMVRDFWQMEPDEVLRYCMAFSARCTELEIHLHRIEGRFRNYKQIRTMQVDKLLQELERQFKAASRTIEVRRQDLELTR